MTRKKKTPRGRIAASFGAGALALALVVVPSTIAEAASKSFSYNCTGWDAFNMQSYGKYTVGHYRNGTLIVSWYNSANTWRSSNFAGGGAATASINASSTLNNWSAACVNFA